MSWLPEGSVLPVACFALIALAAFVSAVAVVTRRNPVAAVAWLVVHFVATACAYVLFNSQFLAAVQVLVYAGAIMVLFLFVIMLLAIDKAPDPAAASGAGRKALVFSLVLILTTVFARALSAPALPRVTASVQVASAAGDAATLSVGAATTAMEEDSVEWLADALMSRHVVAFELSSVLLVAAMAGVLVYTTRRSRSDEPDSAGEPRTVA